MRYLNQVVGMYMRKRIKMPLQMVRHQTSHVHRPATEALVFYNSQENTDIQRICRMRLLKQNCWYMCSKQLQNK